MPDTKFYTKEAALKKSTVIATSLVTSKVRFFKSTFAPNDNTTKAQLVAQEIVADGYTPGGIALTPWTGGLSDPNGGALVTSPMITESFGPASDPPVTDSVGGYWIEDADGDVRLVGTYAEPRPLAAVGDGFQFVEQIVEARNA